MNIKEQKRIYRHKRIRKVINGTSERPRLCVHRSLRGLSAQVIDDTVGKIIFGKSTQSKELKGKIKNGGNIEAAKVFGKIFAAEAVKKGVKKVSFDRGGYLYHGRVKAFADAVREGGVEF